MRESSGPGTEPTSRQWAGATAVTTPGPQLLSHQVIPVLFLFLFMATLTAFGSSRARGATPLTYATAAATPDPLTQASTGTGSTTFGFLTLCTTAGTSCLYFRVHIQAKYLSKSKKMTRFQFSLWLSNIPLYIYIYHFMLLLLLEEIYWIHC